MLKNKQRKEVSLDAETIVILTQQAEKQGRKLKNYMEHVLKQKADNFELSDEYKTMMDGMLERHAKGELNYASWDEVKKLIKRS